MTEWAKGPGRWYWSLPPVVPEGQEVLRVVREHCADGTWRSVHESADGRVRIVINGGEDDGRPDHDGVSFFRPICIGQVLGGFSDEPPEPPITVYSHHLYCGACGRFMGTFGEVHEYCSRCGKGIAHWVYAMGMLAYCPPRSCALGRLSGFLYNGMPERLPVDKWRSHLTPRLLAENAYVVA